MEYLHFSFTFVDVHIYWLFLLQIIRANTVGLNESLCFWDCWMVRLSPRVRVSRRGWLEIWIQKLLFGTFKGGVPQFLHTIRNSLAPNNPKSNFVRFSVWYSEGSSLRLVCSKSWTTPVHSHLQNPKINKEFCTHINIFCLIWQYYS